MKLVAVQSNMLVAVGYDAPSSELEAIFNDGAIWRYKNVSEDVYNQLLAAESKGIFLRSKVMGKYPDYTIRRKA